MAITEIKSQSDVLYYWQNPADHHLSPEDISEELITRALGVIITSTSLFENSSREAFISSFSMPYTIPVVSDLDYRPGFTHEWEVFLHYQKTM